MSEGGSNFEQPSKKENQWKEVGRQLEEVAGFDVELGIKNDENAEIKKGYR